MTTFELIGRLHTIRPHGSYPTTEGSGWRHLQPHQPADPNGIPVTDEAAAIILGWGDYFKEARGEFGGVGASSMFQNKMFIALRETSDGRLTRAEGTYDAHDPSAKRFPVGTLGLYRHDGQFYLIERYQPRS